VVLRKWDATTQAASILTLQDNCLLHDMARTALITGASGFLGRRVVQVFKSAGWNTVGTGLTRANPPSILKINLSESAEVISVLQEVK